MINATLDDWWRDGWWKDLNWDDFSANWPLAMGTEKPETRSHDIQGPCRLTYDEANNLTNMGVKLILTPLPGMMLNKMQGKPHMWEYGTRVDMPAINEGAAVQIAVPDMALMYIDKVRVEEDCCTDNLQGFLDEGWRILAVCPPNSARRPDYILGRRTAKDPFDGS